jgi:hypothetical protein
MKILIFIMPLFLFNTVFAEVVETKDGRMIELKKDGTYKLLEKTKKKKSDWVDAGGGFKHGPVRCKSQMGVAVECVTKVVGNKNCQMAMFTMDYNDKEGLPLAQANCILSNARANTPVVLSCQGQGGRVPASTALHFSSCM